MIEKTSVTIVRHGETEWNKIGRYQGFLDSPLSDKGVDQAHCLAKALKKFEFDALYSSDLGRALQTANIIARELNLNVIEEKRLRERNLGRLQGLTDEEFREKYPDDFGKYKANGFDKELLGGESYRELYERSILSAL